MVDIPRVDWYGCYDGSWQSAPLVAEAYSHPAKVSFNLAERIYRHMLAEGWLRPGDAVLDPFGGVGGFGFHAALYGMHWTGVELEEKFVDLGRQNLDLWRSRYAPHFPGYGSARLVQGDSRRLVEVVMGAGGVVSSPPFENGVPQQDRAFSAPHDSTRNLQDATYGSTPGNIGNNTGDTFWSAAALIVAQCYDILRPGCYAAWVTGDFVRNKKRVPFGEQWLALCESVGFEPVLWAVAWKAEQHGEQLDIFGNGHEHGKTKVSFFRRLANQKSPETAIVNEDVIFVRKPL